MKEEMNPFFSAVAELAVSRGFEVADVNEGVLTLNLNGEFAAMVERNGNRKKCSKYPEADGGCGAGNGKWKYAAACV